MAKHRAFYEESAVWLHGGPMELDGGTLKRKSANDMGALFFCKNTVVGRWYTATYAGDEGKIWMATVKSPVDLILDLTNPQHKENLKSSLTREEFRMVMRSRGKSGHLDWTFAKFLQPLGFRGAVFEERSKGMLTELPPEFNLTNLPEAVLSIGIFHDYDVDVIGSILPESIWKNMVGDRIASPQDRQQIAKAHGDQ